MTTPHSTHSYAADVEASRARITATIDDLQNRLQPRALVGTAVEAAFGGAIGGVMGGGANLLGVLRRLFRDYPVATAAVGLAVGMALIGGNRISRASVNLGEEYEPYSDFEDDYSSAASGIVPEPDTAMVGNPLANNPLATIIAGLAAGALLGALFPQSQAERRLASPIRDRARAAVRAAAGVAPAETHSGQAR